MEKTLKSLGTFSAVVFNAVLGVCLMNGTLYFPVDTTEKPS